MRNKFKIVQIVFAFIYLIIFNYLYLFICLYGLIPTVFLIVCYCFIILKSLKNILYIIPVLTLYLFLFLGIYYTPFLEITILNILIGIIYFSKFNKTFKS